MEENTGPTRHRTTPNQTRAGWQQLEGRTEQEEEEQ